MTKVIGINCHKWLRVIGIVLWSGATLGLSFGIYYGYNGMVNPMQVPPIPDIGLPLDAFDGQLNAHNSAVETNQSNIGLFWLTLFASVFNFIGIWWTVNNHYKFVELKCTSNNSFVEYSSSDKIISNDEYFKQQNPNEVKHE